MTRNQILAAAMMKRAFDDDALAESMTDAAPLVGLLGGAYAGLSPSINPALGLYKDLPGIMGRAGGRATGHAREYLGSEIPSKMEAQIAKAVRGSWLAKLLGGGQLREAAELGARSGSPALEAGAVADVAKRLKGRSRALALALGLALPALGLAGGRALKEHVQGGEEE